MPCGTTESLTLVCKNPRTDAFVSDFADRLRYTHSIAQQEQLAQERDTTLADAAAKDDQLGRLQREQGELLRLRGEVGVLRRQTNELERLRRENRRAQTSDYQTNTQSRLTGTNQSELVVQGLLSSITNPMTTIMVREKEPWFINGKRAKAYGFADGHAEIRNEPPEGFEVWEEQHMLPNPAGP